MGISRIAYLLLFAVLTFKLVAGDDPPAKGKGQVMSAGKNFTASNDIFGTRVFVENRGQFNHINSHGEPILFAFDHGQEKIYFTAKGLIYEMLEIFPLTERQMEEMEEGKNVKQRPDKSHFVYMNWQGQLNTNVRVEASQKQSHYITYGEAEFNSNTFKKLTYYNIYENIDIEYIIPENKAHGIKYNVLLHRGADPGKVKILYSGEVDKIRKKNNGDVFIGTALWDLLEHVPDSYYADGEKLNSAFELIGDTITITFPLGYQQHREVIIDPWVSAVTTLTNNNAAYDVDYDFVGNLYIFGSFGFAKVAKYNSAGVLQWTFSGIVSSQTWSSQIGSANGSVGNFAVDRMSGKTYIGQGANFPRVVRIDGSGNYDNFITPTDNLFQELWEMNFSCMTNDILIVGGGHTSNLSAATINTSTPLLVLSSFNPTNTAFVHDISAFTQDDFGNSFAYYACSNSGLNQKITRVNSTYNGPVWTMPSTFNVFAEINNKTAYGFGNIPSAGFNGLFANNFYLYYYDGNTLAAFDKTTGTLVATQAVGWGNKAVGGIAVDNCDNIYLGGNNQITCYNFNGTTFSTLTPIPLNSTSTNPKVTDIRHNRSTGQLYVCGQGFCGTYSAIYSNSCGSGAGICLFSQLTIAANTSSITCATLGSATIIPNNGVGPFSYTWMPSGQVGPTANGLAPGTHTVVVFDAGVNITYTATTFFGALVPLTATISNTSFLDCFGATNGTAAVANVSGGSAMQSYTWTNGLVSYNTPSISGLGNGNYTITIRDVLTDCIVTNSFSIFQPPQLSCFITANTTTACTSGSISLNCIPSGGTPAYSFTWTNGPQAGTHTVSETGSGPYTYTIACKDSKNCATTAMITLTFVAPPTIAVTNASVCPFHAGTVTASGASTYTWNGITAGASFSDMPTANTTYTVVGSAAGCSSSATASIAILPVPTPTIVSNSPVCNGQNLNMSAAGHSSYIWQGPLAFSSSSATPVQTNVSPANSGVYNLTVTAANSCTASTSVNMTVHPTPTVSASGATICSTQNLGLTSNAGSATTFVWTGVNGYNSFLQNPVLSAPGASASGIYSLTVYSAQNCSNTAVANVTITAMPNPIPINDGPKCEGNNITLLGASSQGGIGFTWTGPQSYFMNTANATVPNVTSLSDGTYTLTITEGPCVISKTTAVVVYPLPTPFASYNNPVCERAALQLSATALPTNTIGTYKWFGPSSYTSSSQNPVRQVAQLGYSGTYTILVTDVLGCMKSTTINVNIEQSPTVKAIGDTVCLKNAGRLIASGASTYTWSSSFGLAGVTPTLQIPSAINVLTLTYSVIGTAANSCTNMASALLATYPLPTISANASPSNQACVGTEFHFKANGALFYEWEGPLGFKSVGAEVNWQPYAEGQSGNYKVTGADIHGCTSSTIITIIVKPLPEGELSGAPTEACVPFCGDYKFIQTKKGAPIIENNWRLNQTLGFTGNLKHCFEVEGDYFMTGIFKDANGCVNTASFMVRGNARPDAAMNIVPEHPVENGDPVAFDDQSTGENIVNWTWSLQDLEDQKQLIYKSQNFTHLFDHSGSYAVALVVKNTKGCADTIIRQLTVEDDFLIFMPNAFTPNDDSNNEVFKPVMRGHKLANLQIFDRWGQEIFFSNEAEKGWDGTYKGQLCKEDAYTWKLDVVSKSGVRKVLTGSVLLYR